MLFFNTMRNGLMNKFVQKHMANAGYGSAYGNKPSHSRFNPIHILSKPFRGKRPHYAPVGGGQQYTHGSIAQSFANVGSHIESLLGNILTQQQMQQNNPVYSAYKPLHNYGMGQAYPSAQQQTHMQDQQNIHQQYMQKMQELEKTMAQMQETLKAYQQLQEKM